MIGMLSHNLDVITPTHLGSRLGVNTSAVLVEMINQSFKNENPHPEAAVLNHLKLAIAKDMKAVHLLISFNSYDHAVVLPLEGENVVDWEQHYDAGYQLAKTHGRLSAEPISLVQVLTRLPGATLELRPHSG